MNQQGIRPQINPLQFPVLRRDHHCGIHLLAHFFEGVPAHIELIGIIRQEILHSAELTGQWEKKLRQIERGEYEARAFLDELKQMTTEVVREVKADMSGMPCPVCRQGRIIRGGTRYGCSRWREGCTYAAPF